MKTCSSCKGTMKEFTGKTPEGVSYDYFRCSRCGEEILDMKQLHKVAETYRKLKSYHAKVSKWGMSLGIRIPKDLVQKYKLKENAELTIVPEEDGLKLVV